jgi:hypothetical protein
MNWSSAFSLRMREQNPEVKIPFYYLLAKVEV